MNSDHHFFADDLSLYVLGELDGERREKVRAHIEECAECRRESQALGGDLAALALTASGPAAPARARQRFMQAIAAEPRQAKSRDNVMFTRPRWWMLAPMFSTALLAVCAILLWVENSDLRDQLTHTQQQAQSQSKDLEHARMVVAAMTAPDSLRVTLVSAHTKPQPQMKIFYSPAKGALILTASNIEAAPSGKIYQIWLIPKNGKAPMPAGTFNPDAHGGGVVMLPQMAENMEVKAFAVTLEPSGGSQTPTLPILMTGEAAS